MYNRPTNARSAMMAAVKQKNTTPEIIVRQCLHKKGLRFRLHRRDLPGTPDIVLPKLRLAIFVHGCFWHQHLHCRRATFPKTNQDFWKKKFEKNLTRDKLSKRQLESAGWQVAVIWECETKSNELLESSVSRALSVQTNDLQPMHRAHPAN